MNLKRVRKRDLCSLIRYLNFYHLSRDRIHYFSIRVKEELVKDLAKLYEIRETPDDVSFRSTYPPCPTSGTGWPTDSQWYMAGLPVTLPKSRKDCVRRLHILRRRTVLKF